jgi:hypothetical protein
MTRDFNESAQERAPETVDAINGGRRGLTLIKKQTMSTGQLRRRLYHTPISRVRSCIRGDARRLGDVGNSGEKMSEESERSNSARKLISL